MDNLVKRAHVCESPGSSSQHAAAAAPQETLRVDFGDARPAVLVTDPQDAEFCDDMERALQLSAEEATYREVRAVLAEDAAPTAPPPAPESARVTAECAVCWETATQIVTPCGHFCLCENCSDGFTKCPICRGDVQGIFKVFVT